MAPERRNQDSRKEGGLASGKWGEMVEEELLELGLRRQDVQEFDWQRLKGKKEGWRRKAN